MKIQCVHCGGSNLCKGAVRSESNLYFLPDSCRFLTLSFGVRTKAVACLDCGVTTMLAEPDEVRDFIIQPQQKLQFSLRALLLVLTLVAIVLGVVALALR